MKPGRQHHRTEQGFLHPPGQGRRFLHCAGRREPRGLLLPHSPPVPRRQIAGFKDLADSVHAYGAKIGVQIFHPEYDVNALIELFQKKDMMGVRQKMHHDMEHYVTDVTEEQLMDIIQKMCDCAVRAQKAGIDFVQVHGDRLVGCLCSPLMNRRTDKFGGSSRTAPALR